MLCDLALSPSPHSSPTSSGSFRDPRLVAVPEDHPAVPYSSVLALAVFSTPRSLALPSPPLPSPRLENPTWLQAVAETGLLLLSNHPSHQDPDPLLPSPWCVCGPL